MVFSQGLAREEANLGKAIAVPCKKLVHGIADLAEEAEALWAAERKPGKPSGCISAKWGCVALVVNPARPIPDVLRKDWATRVLKEPCYGCFNHEEEEEAIVERSGALDIPWPQCTDCSLLEFNGLLATATNPTLIGERYPSPQQIAKAWKDRADDTYFRKNRENNITTFQDGEIESYLDEEISA